MPQKPLVIVTRKLPDAIETRMMELFSVRLNLEDAPLSQAQLIDAVKTADVLVPTVTDRIDAKVLSQAGPKLKLIASRSIQYDRRLKNYNNEGLTPLEVKDLWEKEQAGNRAPDRPKAPPPSPEQPPTQ